MAKTVTRADLRTAVRNRGEFRAPYITDTEINNYINQSLAHLYDIIIAADPTYYLTQTNVSITSGTRSYALPSDFYKCVGVALTDVGASDGFHTLDTFNFEERWDSITLSSDNDTRYEIRGDNILFHPTPTFTKTAILEYIPTPTELNDDVTTWDSVNLWTEWVIMDVLIACGAKEESDVSVWAAQREKLEKRIIGAGKRDLGKPKTSSTSSTLKALRHTVRNRGSWTEADISDNQLTSFVNTSLAALRDLVAKNDPSHFLTYEDITVSSGTREYSLPTDFYKIVGVDAADAGTSDGHRVMEFFNWEERYDDTYAGTLANTRYHIRGNNIYFHPTPTWNGTVRLEYIPTFTELSDPTDTFDMFNHWHEWVILDCAIKCCAAKGTDPQVYLAQQAKAEERIANFGARDLAEGKTVSTENTLQNLQLAVRQRGNWPKGQINDSQLTAFLNDSLGSLVDVMSIHDPAYFMSDHVYTMVIDQQSYALPSDFYKSVSVSVYTNASGTTPADGYYGMDKCEWNELTESESQPATTNPRDIRWTVRGDNLWLTPWVAGFASCIKLRYIAEPTLLASPTDTVNYPNRWVEWAVLDTCIKCCSVAGTDPQAFMAQQQKVEERISAFSKRDMSERPTSWKGWSTLKDLVRAIRSRGRWESAAVTDNEIVTLLYDAELHLLGLLSDINPEFFYDEKIISVSSGTRSYNLNGDVHKILGVSYYDAALTDGYAVMEPFRWDERWDSSVASSKATTRYCLHGVYLWLHPTPTWTGKIKLEYIKKPQIPSTLASTSPSYPLGFLHQTAFQGDGDSDATFASEHYFWVGWMVADVAGKLAIATNQDPAPFLAERNDIEEKLKIYYADRDLSDQTTVSSEGTLKNMRLSVRNRGNWSEADITDNQLTAWVNSSISGLRDMLVQIDPSYLATDHYFTIASGTREYSLPSDFLKVVGVDAYDSAITDGYSTLEHFNWNERYDTTPTSSKTYTRYHIRGEKLYLHPTPTWSGTVRMEYIPEFTNLVSPTDTVDLYNNWQEWVILDCCVKASAATGSDPQLYMAQQQQMEKRIRDFSARDLVETSTPSTDGTNLRNLQLAVRNRGNWPKEALNDSQLTAWINSSISAFVDLISKHEPAYYLTRSDITVSSGTKEYALPTNFYKLHGVAVEDSSQPDGYAILNRFNWDERYDYTYSADKWDTRYMIRGNNIQLHPTPNWSGTIRLEYVPIPTALVQPTDTFTFYNNWQEWVILDACVKVCGLLGTDPSVFVAQLQATERRIVGYTERDIGEPKSVVDYNRSNRYDPRLRHWRGRW